MSPRTRWRPSRPTVPGRNAVASHSRPSPLPMPSRWLPLYRRVALATPCQSHAAAAGEGVAGSDPRTDPHPRRTCRQKPARYPLRGAHRSARCSNPRSSGRVRMVARPARPAPLLLPGIPGERRPVATRPETELAQKHRLGWPESGLAVSPALGPALLLLGELVCRRRWASMDHPPPACKDPRPRLCHVVPGRATRRRRISVRK